MAIEPYMRRFWPASLISWNRFLSRRFRDPLVASHVLAGLTAWTVTLAAEVPLWQFVPVGPPYRIETLKGANAFAGFLVMSVPSALTATLRFLVVIVVVRLAARRRLWIADALACIAFALTGPPVDTSTVQGAVISLTLVLIMAIVLLWLVKRFGLLALFAALFGGMLVSPTVMATWYASHGLAAQSVVVVTAGWSVWVIVSSNGRARDSRQASAA